MNNVCVLLLTTLMMGELQNILLNCVIVTP